MNMKQKNLNFSFHDPNAEGVMEKYIVQIMVEHKVEQLAVVANAGSCCRENEPQELS